MSEYQIRIAKPGKSVFSEDPRDFNLRSDINMLKVARKDSSNYYSAYGTFTLEAANNNYATLNIAHNFGYKPNVFAFVYDPDDSKWHSIVNLGALCGIYKRPDNNNVVLYFYNRYTDGISGLPGTRVIYYKYYIVIEPRQDAWYSQSSGTSGTFTTRMGDYGLIISKPGKGVTDAGIPDTDLVFASYFYTFKIYKQILFNAAGSQAHGLSYPPTFFAFYNNSGRWQPYKFATADNTNITVADANVYVILAMDPLNE